MDEGTSQVGERLRSSRQEFGSQLRRLGERARDVPWRGYYERSPWLFVAAAFAGGVLLSAAVSGRRRAGVLEHDRLERGAKATSEMAARARSSDTSEIWERIKATLLAVAGSQISSFIREIAPSVIGQNRSPRQPEMSSARSRNGSDNGDDRARPQA